MATGFQPDKEKKLAAGELPQFARPLRAPLMLDGQVNPANAALVANARSPVGQPGPVSPAPANTVINQALPANPATMVQGPEGVTAPGQRYPAGRSLVPMGAAVPVSDGRGLVPVDAGRGFTPPFGGSYDRNTIFQGSNTAAPSNLATP
ncbi:MAG: hypothetical protein JWR74_1335, partial [Polaromonas sp.]|nr:hypothetical protein [Polaromonas sp.]